MDNIIQKFENDFKANIKNFESIQIKYKIYNKIYDDLKNVDNFEVCMSVPPIKNFFHKYETMLKNLEDSYNNSKNNIENKKNIILKIQKYKNYKSKIDLINLYICAYNIISILMLIPIFITQQKETNNKQKFVLIFLILGLIKLFLTKR